MTNNALSRTTMKTCAHLWKRTCATEFPPEKADRLQLMTTGAVVGAFRRARSWYRPTNWTSFDWHKELRQETLTAGIAAVRQHSSHERVAIGAFVYQTVVGQLRTRFRAEWRFTSHICGSDLTIESADQLCSGKSDASFQSARVHSDLRIVLESLTEPHGSLLVKLYWEGATEAEIGKLFGMTQAGVHARKQRALEELRARF